MSKVPLQVLLGRVAYPEAVLFVMTVYPCLTLSRFLRLPLSEQGDGDPEHSLYD